MSAALRRFALAAVLAATPIGAGAQASSGEASVLPGPVVAKVLDVVDGDTLHVRVMIWLGQELETRVRVEGVDTPERRGRCPRESEMAEEAKRFVQRFVASGVVELRDVQHDKYGGRVRARIATAAGADLGQALVRSGLARPYGGEARASWCSVAELR